MLNDTSSPRVRVPSMTCRPPTPSTPMRPICGSSSMAGRYLARIFAASIDTRRMSSASTSSFADCTDSAPNPLMTRTPLTVSSTTVANSACSCCTACTAGWIDDENRRPAKLTSGNGASATTVSSGLVSARMTVTEMTIARFDSVIGIITTNAWICWRSLDERLISWPVCDRSW